MQALMTSKERPKYPEDARNQHIEGVVVLDVEIGKDGAVCDVALISGHPMLAQAAIDAVRSWKYRPYLLNGEPIEVETSAQVNFTLTP
jgi:protein TonB